MAKNSVKYLSRDDLLSGSHFRCHDLSVGDGTLRIRELTAEEWLTLGKEEREANEKNKENPDDASLGLGLHFARVARLVCQVAVDAEGKRIFEDGDEDKITQHLGAETLMQIYKQLAQVAPTEGGVTGGPSAPTAS